MISSYDFGVKNIARLGQTYLLHCNICEVLDTYTNILKVRTFRYKSYGYIPVVKFSTILGTTYRYVRPQPFLCT